MFGKTHFLLTTTFMLGEALLVFQQQPSHNLEQTEHMAELAPPHGLPILAFDFSTASQQILRDEKARTRFQQLSGQYRGYGALSDPELQQRLNLTDDQRQKIDQLQNYWNGRMNRLNDGFRRDGERSSTEYNHLQQGLRKQLNDVLNDQQRQEWLQVIGDPFDFPAESYFDGEESSPSNRARNDNRKTDADRKN